MKAIHLICFILLFLVGGGFFGSWFSMARDLSDFNFWEFTEISRTIIHRLASPMAVLMPLSLLFLVISLVFYHPKGSRGFYFNIASVILMLITLFITLYVLVPIDHRIEVWSQVKTPLNWQLIRDYWEKFHAIRTWTAMGSFVCFAYSSLYHFTH